MQPFIGGRGAPVFSGSQRHFALRYACAYGNLVIERTEYHIALAVVRDFRDLKMCRANLVSCGVSVLFLGCLGEELDEDVGEGVSAG